MPQPEPERTPQANINPVVRIVAEIIFTFAFRIYLRTRVRGKQHLPKHGPYIIVANHLSLIDPPLVGWAAWPQTLYFMAKEELWDSKVMGWILGNLGGFAVNRNVRDTTATRRSLAILKDGKCLVTFPEGTRSTDGELQQMRTGAIRLASKLRCPIIPAYITGTNKVLPKGSRFPRPHRVSITFGPPFELTSLYDHSPTAAETEAAVLDMSQRLGSLAER